MTQESHDPAMLWSLHLSRLDAPRRHAVVGALRHSTAGGWPASEDGVKLLVAYAMGEITSRSYADGILDSMGVVDHAIAAPVEERAEPVAGAVPLEPMDEPRRISREDAVQAYVTGLIPVGEFLRITRG